MKIQGTVIKILITLILAVLYVWTLSEKRATDDRCEGLKAWYDAYNETYFANTLPKDVVIDYTETANNIDAATFRRNERFYMALNAKRVSSPLFAHLLILHESCHIKTWDELPEHGPRWVACMNSLESAGAFHNELINQFSERK